MYFSYSLLPLLNSTLRWPSLLSFSYIVLSRKLIDCRKLKFRTKPHNNLFISLFITASHSTVRTPANTKREGVSQPRQGRKKGRRRKKEPAWISSDCNKMRNTKSKSRRDKALKKAEGRKVLSFLGKCQPRRDNHTQDEKS